MRASRGLSIVRIVRQATRATALLSFVLLAPACSRSVGSFLGPNQPPALEIVDARGLGGTGVRVRWAARDPDGRLAPTHWRLSPWTARPGAGEEFTTTLEECVIAPALLTSTRATATGAAREPQRFTVWAVDAAGARSEPATLALFANNVAPTVTITAPTPTALLRAQTLVNLCIVWNGVDPDGATGKPVKYKFEMLDLDDPANEGYLADPDSLRRLAVATNWAGWDSTSADTEHIELTNLNIGSSYLFTVTGFDDQGDYDPVFSLNKNMLQFTTNYPGIGPQLSISGPAFGAPQPQFYDLVLDPRAVIQTEVAAGSGLTFNWSAIPPGSSGFQRGSRWAVDIVDPNDETPRSGPGDLRHWSEWDPSTTVTLAPYSPVGLKREEHTLYVEGRSNPSTCVIPGSDMVTLGAVHFVVVQPTFDKDLLVVDDTRLEVDRIGAGGCLASYTKVWPSATELDTFLYARGGVPWRCTLNPPSGVTSVPGILAGYAFDTLGTRGVISGRVVDLGGGPVQSQALPLSVLANYRHVLWLTDGLGALNTGDPTDAVSPITAMRFMSGTYPVVNVLTTYVKMGGKLWLAGGGTASASLQPWNRKLNDSGNITRFSSAPAYGEIFPGAMVWEAPHLRSEISLAIALQGARSLGRFESAPGGYDALPLTLDSRTAATDPLPPTRTVPSLFYTTTRPVEFVTQPNFIIEGGESVLDSLYVVQGSTVPIGTGNVAMTVYHGGETGQCIWTGFDLWSFQRSECIQLVDGVLQGIWGLPRGPVVRGPGNAPAFARRVSAPPRLATRATRALPVR